MKPHACRMKPPDLLHDLNKQPDQSGRQTGRPDDKNTTSAKEAASGEAAVRLHQHRNEPNEATAAAGSRRSTRTRRPVTRLIETCPILESETEIGENEMHWCLTVASGLSETQATAVATVDQEYDKTVKFESLTTAGYSAHVFTTDRSGNGILNGLRKVVGDKITSQVEESIRNKSAQAGCRSKTGSRLLTARGVLPDNTEEEAVSNEAVSDAAAYTELEAAAHTDDWEAAPSKYNLS